MLAVSIFFFLLLSPFPLFIVAPHLLLLMSFLFVSRVP
jgi:hypothetical protein